MKQKYEYILIDSRTGVSDTSGICTIQMPDTLVACTTLNNQSLVGMSAVLESIRSKRNPGDLRVFPTIMRIELAEKDKLEAALGTARRLLSEFLPYLTESEKTAYWKDTDVLYYPYYAYEEVLATFGDRLGTSTSDLSLLSTMERLGRHITGISTLAMPELAEGRGGGSSTGMRMGYRLSGKTTWCAQSCRNQSFPHWMTDTNTMSSSATADTVSGRSGWVTFFCRSLRTGSVRNSAEIDDIYR